MPYDPVKLDDIGVTVGNSSAVATASIRHDETGQLSIVVRRPWTAEDWRNWWTAPPTTIRSPDGQRPSLTIDRTRLRATDETGDHFWAREVQIEYSPAALEEGSWVHASYYLTGLSFPDGIITFDIRGIRWTLELLDGLVTTHKSIDRIGLGAVTAVLRSEIAMYARRLEVEKVAMDIVLLLTFGAGTQISIARVDYEREGAILSTRLLSLKREMRTFWRGPVWSHMTRQGIVKPYLENSYPNLTATALVFPMARLITILVDVRGESMVHTQGLLLANFLEIVRYNYARNVLCRQDKATQKGDRFRHVGQKNDWSFHEIWADFLKANGIGGWNASYKDFRNALSHGEELAGATLEEQHDLVLHILNFCDRIILALLQWDAVKGGYIPCHLPETTEHDENGVFTVKLNYVPFART